MRTNGAIKTSCADMFPHGVAVMGEATPVVDFERSTRENRVQAHDEETGRPLWTVDVMDFDPEARERTLKVKIASPVKPVLPEELANTPLRPVFLEGLTVTPYIQEVGQGRAKIAYSLQATGFLVPRSARENKAV